MKESCCVSLSVRLRRKAWRPEDPHSCAEAGSPTPAAKTGCAASNSSYRSGDEIRARPEAVPWQMSEIVIRKGECARNCGHSCYEESQSER